MKTGEKMRDIFIRKDTLRKYLQYKINDTENQTEINVYYDILKWVNQKNG